MSEKIKHYRQQAENAERLAKSAETEDERAAYQRIAAVWRDLADTREQMKGREEG